jgi:anti-sigma B factor antagonist
MCGETVDTDPKTRPVLWSISRALAVQRQTIHFREANSMFNSGHLENIGPDTVPMAGEPCDLALRWRLPMKMTTSTRQVGGVTVIDITGRIELGEESAAVRDLVCDLLSQGHTQILLNLGEVHYIDSMGLGTLVSAFTSVRKQGGELKLLNLTNKVRDLMQITKLYTIFDILNDEETGVKSFSESTAATA